MQGLEGLVSLLNALGSMIAPAITFALWIFPLKIWWLHDGERGVVCTWGCVRNWKWWRSADRGPGVTFYTCFEMLIVIQAIGCYVDLSPQTFPTSDGRVIEANGSLFYAVNDPRKAILLAEDLPEQLEAICMDLLRRWSHGKASAEIMACCDVGAELKDPMAKALRRYGCRPVDLVLADLWPHPVQMACDCIDRCAKSMTAAIDLADRRRAADGADQ